MLTLPRTAAKFADIAVTATLATGGAATVTGVDVALVPAGTMPSATTTWVAAHQAGSVWQVLLVGPDAIPTSPPVYKLSIPATGGWDLYGRVTDNPEVDVALIDHIEME